MPSQLQIDFTKPLPVHIRENNRESEDFLNENRWKFSDRCIEVIEPLISGVRLTVKSAIVDYGVSSLPRRISDIREATFHELIDDDWVYVDGKQDHKIWWMPQEYIRMYKCMFEKMIEQKKKRDIERAEKRKRKV